MPGTVYTYAYTPELGYLSGILQGTSGNAWWIANDLDAEFHVTGETLANNGLAVASIATAFDPTTGNVTAISASGNNANNLANLTYQWDNLGNMLFRGDGINQVYDNFCYDDLNRLDQYSVNGTSCSNGTIVKTIGYDGGTPGAYQNGSVGDGNITVKSDLGGYTYGAGRHAATSINTTATGGCSLANCNLDGMSSPNIYYDADGNLQCITTRTNCDVYAGRSYGWTSFDMVEMVASGANTANIAYTPEHERGSQTVAGVPTYYLNNPDAGIVEEAVAGSTTAWRTYLKGYGRIVAELSTSGGTTTPYYYVADNLFSTTSLSDTGGNRKEYDSYDAWGKRRYASGTDSPGCNSSNPKSMVTRGFTGQEEMDVFCLVNLNARIYDPTLGRMMSEDPIVADSTSAQSFNGYTYAANNPLALADPTGEMACNDQRELDDNCATDQEYYLESQMSSATETVVVTASRYEECDEACGGDNGSGTGGGGSGNDGGGKATANTCSAKLPNGQTVGDVVAQQRAVLSAAQNAAQTAAQYSPAAPGSGYVLGTFIGIVSPGGPIDFKNNFRGRGDAVKLGQEGNFAYYAIGSDFLPVWVLDFGAGAYGMAAATSGQKSWSNLTGPMLSDSSAASQRSAGLSANGCAASGK